MVAKKSSARKIRLVVQIFIFALIALITLSKTLEETGIIIPFLSTASLHALCPFGGVVSLYQYITTGTLVQKVHESSLVLMYIVILLTLAFGGVFCGWVCPLGSIQEWIGKIGRKIFKRKYNNFVPAGIDKYLRYLRYGVLAWVIYATAVTGKLIFVDVDPYFALFNFWSSEVAVAALVILGLTLVGAIFVERPWCKYFCPYGAFLGLGNLIRVFKIRRNNSTCISCKACDRECPMNIKVSESKVVLNHQCITCLECTSELACPVDNTVNLSVKGVKM
ncbi:MAG: ferredoxin [Firmicutes bacterium HGW-Firmicutes-12]|jgi:polyferredoxin|nr:MAG: ferredoxin [Firmicutes bacterium HGW-Firmicutes-12]